jgi:hypothetical protein
MVNDHALKFHPVPLGQAGQIERDTGVLNSHDFYDRARAAVFEDASE